MDVETLYNMARAAARAAQTALETPAGDKDMLVRFTGYLACVGEYNRLVPYAAQLFGAEAKSLFQQIDLGKASNPFSAAPVEQKLYLDFAAARLNALTAYLQSKVTSADRVVQSVIDLIRSNLRPAMFSPPEKEDEVQNALEVIFRARGLDYRRGKDRIEYSSKAFIPDFTFQALDLALEVKLCNRDRREKEIVDEINADIPAYQTKYRRVLFVVFDLGFIRDEPRFKSSIEANPDVYVLVVKM